ncbi:MAG: cyclic-di-AMP receptor [Anaerolineales bacterium]|nr:cyclic-di-AMP receptor [Anaerolineales bacterium]
MKTIDTQPIKNTPIDEIRKNSNYNCLIIAIIQLQDERKATRALKKLGLTCYHQSSTGAFLERKNAILLIGLNDEDKNKAIEAIRKTCHERTEYVSTPLEGAPLPIPLSTPILVGGAIVFILPIEHYEEI